MAQYNISQLTLNHLKQGYNLGPKKKKNLGEEEKTHAFLFLASLGKYHLNWVRGKDSLLVEISHTVCLCNLDSISLPGKQ